MPLGLITGGANTGKTGKVFELATNAVREGKRPAILLPTRPDVGRIRSELADRCPMGVTVERFERYVENVWPARGDGRAIIRPGQRSWLMARCATALSAPPGLSNAAARVLDRLAGSAGEKWREAAFADAHGGGDILQALLAAYAAELVTRKLLEPGEAVHILGARDCLPHDPIIFHRFTDLTPAQEHLAFSAAASERSVVIVLTWEEGRFATEAVSPLVERIAEIAKTRIHLDEGSHTTVGELERIERELFDKPIAAKPGGHVTFSTAEGSEGEADRICAEVQGLMDEHGLEPGEIAIVFREAGLHASQVVHALEEAGIRADVDTAVPLTKTPLGRALVSLARFIAGGDCQDLLGFVRSGYVFREHEHVFALEEAWRRGADEESGALLGRLPAEWREKVATRLVRPQTTLAETAEVWEDVLGMMLEARWGEGGVECIPDSDAMVQRAVIRLLQDISDLEEGDTDPGAMLAALQSTHVAPSSVERSTHVQIMDAERIRGRRFEAVVLGGLNAGQFPKKGEDLLDSPSVKRLFHAVDVNPSRPRTAQSERLLFYTAVTRARKHLVLSRCSTDSAGSQMGPSVFWEELRDFYRNPTGADRDARIDGLDKHSGIADIALSEHASTTTRRILREGAIALCRGEGEADIPQRIARARVRSEGPLGRIQDPELLKELQGRSEFSAGEIEAYARCPFQWFMHRVVRPDSIERKTDGLSLGSLAHAALAKAYEILRDEHGYSRMSAETMEIVSAIAHEAVDDGMAMSAIPERDESSARAWAVPRVIRSLRTDIDLLPGFDPTHMEMWLAQESESSVELGTFRLKGRVDRVDVHSDGRAVVIDYKSGSSSSYSLVGIQRQPWLQVPLYAAAVGEGLGLEVVGGLYKGLSKGKARGFYAEERCPSEGLAGKDATDIDEVVSWAIELAEEAVAGIREGIIEPSEPGDHCMYCSAIGYCRGRES